MNTRMTRSPDAKKLGAHTKIPKNLLSAKGSVASRSSYYADFQPQRTEIFRKGQIYERPQRSKSIDEKMPLQSRRSMRQESPPASIKSSFVPKIEVSVQPRAKAAPLSCFLSNSRPALRQNLPLRLKKKTKSSEKTISTMPSQGIIQHYESLEMDSISSHTSDSNNRNRVNPFRQDRLYSESDATLSGLSQKSGQLKNLLVKKMKLFECLQFELDRKNKELLDTYNSMKVLHKKVKDSGDVVCNLPSLTKVRQKLESKLKVLNSDDVAEPDKVDKVVQYPDAETKAKHVELEVNLIMTKKELEQYKEDNRKLQAVHEQTVKELHEGMRALNENLKQKVLLAEIKTKDLEVVLQEKDQLKGKLLEFQEQIDKIELEMSKNIETEASVKERIMQEVTMRESIEVEKSKLEAQLEEKVQEIQYICQSKQDLECQLENAIYASMELDAMKGRLVEQQRELEDYKKKIKSLEQNINEQQCEKESEQKFRSGLNRELDAKHKELKILNEETERLRAKCDDLEYKTKEYKKCFDALRIHLNMNAYQGTPDNIACVKDITEGLKEKLSVLCESNCNLEDELSAKDKKIAEIQEKLSLKEEQIIFLTKKEKEQIKTMDLLQNSLEMKRMADGDINRQLSQKSEELNSLTTTLEIRKRQLRQMKKIIYTLEEKLVQSSLQKKKDKEQIMHLKRMLESIPKIPQSPDYGLDELIREIESEIYGENDYSDENDRILDSDGDGVDVNVISKASPTRFMLESAVQRVTTVTSNDKSKNIRRRLDRVISSRSSLFNKGSGVKLLPCKKYKYGIRMDPCNKDM